MNNQTKLLVSGLLACGGILVACGDSSGTGGSGGTTSSSTTSVTSSAKTTGVGSTSTTTKASSSTGMGFPVPPTLGTQIDRMGRPAVNTAANQTFLAGAVVSTTALREAAQDAYNHDAVPANWSTYAATMASQLGVLDALDAPDTANPIGCGNQAFAGGSVAAGAYTVLSTVLSNDQIWVNTKTTATCAGYLAVETAANDCGGRRPADDVIKTTYTVVSGIQAVGGFDDGITDPGNHQATFPYLVAPH